MTDKIRKLINNNSWNKILSLIKNDTINPTEKIINNNTIIHIAVVNNEFNLIKFFQKKYPEGLEKLDSNGNTPIHTMAIYGYDKTLKFCIEHNEKYINLLNVNNETILNIIFRNFSLFNWILKKYKHININNVTYNDETIITQNIKESKNIKDEYYNNLKLLLKHKPNFNIPKNNPPLIYAIELKKDYIVKLLLKNNNINVNVMNSNFITPIITAFFNNNYDIINLLINNGADINYQGAEGDSNPLVLAILRNDDKMINFLINKGFDINQHNRFLETPLHIALASKKKLSLDTLSKMIYYGNINKQDINGKTPLHFLFKNYNWKNFRHILENKKINIFKKDKYGKSPINYISNYDFSFFIDSITKNYINQLKKNNINYNFNNKFCRNNIESTKCKHIIRKYILNTKRSYPHKRDVNLIDNKLKIIRGVNTDYGKFNSDILHNMIYTIQLLKKYPNLFIPFQYAIDNKEINDKILLMYNDFHKTTPDKIMSDIIKLYTDIFYEMAPYIILWRSPSQYYIHTDIDLYILKCLEVNNIRYIFIKLTLIPSSFGTHANILIFDKNSGILERFEPYGRIPYLENNKLDDLLKNRLSPIFINYLNKYNKKFKYISPTDYVDGLSFQILSNDDQDTTKKLGDPAGYCLAWTYWYLEMRLNNNNIPSAELVRKSTNNIINNKSKYDNRYPFIDFIRDYSTKLDKLKNKFLIAVGISKKNIYNLILSEKEQNLVIDKLKNDFTELINNRIIIYK